MRGRNQIVLIIAVFLGLMAVFLANTYLNSAQDRQESLAEAGRMTRVVVASQELTFGALIGGQNIRLVNWPASSVPAGAFSSIEDVTRVNRVALRPIAVGEPLLSSRVSGANGRATLSALLPEGKVAVAVPISDVGGVGGFVRPGDSVDVLLTRQIPGPGAAAEDKMTDVVLEAVQVLGVDQVYDENNTTPVVGKTATLQVDTFGAQKLALARELGTLSLALRNVANPITGSRGTVTSRQLSASRILYCRKSRTESGRGTGQGDHAWDNASGRSAGCSIFSHSGSVDDHRPRCQTYRV